MQPLTAESDLPVWSQSIIISKYRGADKSLARPGRKQATATEKFDVHIIIIGIQPLGRSGQRPNFSQATGMAVVRCILGKFLGVACHCFPRMFIYPIYNHNWRNIITIYIYNETIIKRNILTIKKTHREVGQAKDLSAPRYVLGTNKYLQCVLWKEFKVSFKVRNLLTLRTTPTYHIGNPFLRQHNNLLQWVFACTTVTNREVSCWLQLIILL